MRFKFRTHGIVRSCVMASSPQMRMENGIDIEEIQKPYGKIGSEVATVWESRDGRMIFNTPPSGGKICMQILNEEK